MPLTKCPECFNEISDSAESCPICGKPLHQGWKIRFEDGACFIIDEDYYHICHINAAFVERFAKILVNSQEMFLAMEKFVEKVNNSSKKGLEPKKQVKIFEDILAKIKG